MNVDQIFFLKDDNQRRDFFRDIAHKITFFQSLPCFIFLKHLLLRTLVVNIAKFKKVEADLQRVLHI